MIRFVRIRAKDDVVLDNDGHGIDGFAWFDTITDRFLDWGQDSDHYLEKTNDQKTLH